MPGGAVRSLSTTNDVNRIEAPVTWKAYLICAFASFGGIFFGYDSGYINGATSNLEFIHFIEGPGKDALSSSHSSLIVSILSCGTFFGALIAGDVADIIGRKWTVIIGCVVRTVACPALEIQNAQNMVAIYEAHANFTRNNRSTPSVSAFKWALVLDTLSV